MNLKYRKSAACNDLVTYNNVMNYVQLKVPALRQ